MDKMTFPILRHANWGKKGPPRLGGFTERLSVCNAGGLSVTYNA